jgi:hypothetical protein
MKTQCLCVTTITAPFGSCLLLPASWPTNFPPLAVLFRSGDVGRAVFPVTLTDELMMVLLPFPQQPGRRDGREERRTALMALIDGWGLY